MMNKKRKLRKGLSLVEIVAVIAIIAVISLVGLARFSSAREGAMISTLDSTFMNMRTAMSIHAANNGGQAPENLLQIAQNMEIPSNLTAPTSNDEAREFFAQLFDRIATASVDTDDIVFTNNDGVARLTVTISGINGDHPNRLGTVSPAGSGSAAAATRTYTLQHVMNGL